ncbi:MAG: translocation/assembly module TamB domain-containing protein [Oceanicaulis sp.]
MRKPLAWLSGILTFTVALLAGVILALTGPLGREIARAQLDGREIAGFGELDLGRIEGNLLGAFEVSSLAVEDEEGAWLRLETVAIEWDWLALLDRRVQIHAIAAERVEVLRRPEREPRDDSEGGSFDLELALDEIAIGTVYLAEGVAGPEALFAVDAAVNNTGGGWSGRLDATRLDAAGDSVEAAFRYDEVIDIDAVIEAAPGGPLATLLRAPDQGAVARVDASGDLLAGSGEASLIVGGEDALSFTADWTDERLAAQGRVDPVAWPEFERLGTLLGGPAQFDLVLPLGEGLNDPLLDQARISLEAPAASLTAAPAGDERYAISGTAGPGLVSALTGEQLSAGSLTVEEGIVDLSGADFAFSGDVTATELDLPGEYYFGRVSGPLSVQGPASNVSVTGDLTTSGVRYGNEVVADLLGDSPAIDASVRYDREAERLTIERGQIGAAAGPLSVSGTVSVGAERFDVSASSPSFEAGRLTDQLSGTGAIDVSAQGSFDGAVEFTADVSDFEPEGDLAERLPGPIDARVIGARTAEGALTFDQVRLQSPDLALEGTGSQTGETYDFEGEAVYSGDSPVGGVSLAGTLEAAFEAEYGPDGIDARIDAEAGQVTAGPVRVDGARLRVRAEGPLDDVSGQARLTGESPRGPVDVSADFARQGETLQLLDLSGPAGGFTVEGGAQVAPGAIDAELDVAPIDGFGALEISASLQDGELDVQASAKDLIGGDLEYFDVFSLTLSGPLEDADFTLVAQGAFGARFRFTADGEMRLAGGPFAASASLEGDYGPVDIATAETLTVSADPLTAQADLRVGEGRATLTYAGGDDQRIEADLTDVPAAILSLRRAREPVQGTLGGTARLTRSGGVWTGEARIAGEDLQPGEATEFARPVDGTVALTLTGEAVRLDVSAQGPDLSATAQGRIVTGPVTGPEALTQASNPVEATARVEGRIGSIAAFHLGAGQSLTGQADLVADVSGTVGDPNLQGQASLTDARFTDSASGVDLQELRVAANFTESRAEITELSAVDGEGGTLSGGGTVEVAGGLEVDAQARFTEFRVVDRDDVSAAASGTVDFTLEGSEGLVSGAATVVRAEVSPPDAGRASIPTIEVTEVNVPASVRRQNDDAGDQDGITIALDYEVSAPRRIFVRGGNFDTEWGAELAIQGSVSDPEVYGTVRAVRGRADLLGRVFEIEQGVVRLTGEPSEAQLDLTAVREERDITARIVVEGAVTNPDISLTSSPSLPPDEVASRILFGEGAANLSGLQAAQLAASLASLSGGGGGFDPLGALRQASGLDQLGVRQDAEGDTVVSGGRYISEDVYLELQSGTSTAAPTTTIEWELTRRFTLLSRVTADGEAGGALSWRTEYDDDPFGEGGLFDFDRLDIFGLGGGDDADESDDDGLELDGDPVTPDVPERPTDPDSGVMNRLPRRDG